MRTIVITRMYAGSYLNDNLGGEAINLLHDDHNNNYVFVGKLGFIDPKYNDTVQDVILTRLTKAGVFEVLGAAKIGKNGQIAYKQDLNAAKIKLNEYIKNNDVRYGGVLLNDIFKDLYGADISFKSEELLLPKEPLFITDSHNKDFVIEDAKTSNLVDKRFSTTSLHLYITDKDNPDSYKELSRLIEDESLWERRINKVVEDRIVDKHFNFLDIVRKDYDELAYSNLFSYIFKSYPELFIKFSKEVLGVEIKSPYLIYREKANIDLWVEDDNSILVIENKIKSGINGVSSRHNFSEGGLVQSQLLKYYDYTEKEKGNKSAHYYLFVPNYNKINLKIYSGSKYYKEIRYSEIYNFFAKQDVKDKYYLEFINALYKHTKDREVDYAEDMAFRFLSRIKKN